MKAKIVNIREVELRSLIAFLNLFKKKLMENAKLHFKSRKETTDSYSSDVNL